MTELSKERNQPGMAGKKSPMQRCIRALTGAIAGIIPGPLSARSQAQ